MSESAIAQEPAPKHERTAHRAGGDIVSANGLATHLGMTRQNVARLTAEAVIEQRSDGRYDQTASRLKYIKHLRTERARSPKHEADAEHTAAKVALLRIQIAEKQRELVRRAAVDALIDGIGPRSLILTRA